MRLTAATRELIRRARHERAVADRGRPVHTSEVFDLRLMCALSHLSMDEREVWIDRVVLGRTLEDISRRLISDAHPRGVTRERVRQLEVQAHRKLDAVIERKYPALFKEWREGAEPL